MQDRKEKHKDAQVLTDGDGCYRSKMMVSVVMEEALLSDDHEGPERSARF